MRDPGTAAARAVCLALLLLAGGIPPASAQNTCPCPPPPPPDPVWTGSIGAGLAFTSGNTDTSSVNVSFDVKRDPKTKTVFKADGLYLRSSRDGDAIVDRSTLNGRVEYAISPRAYAFGQVQYARDQFKRIDYLIAPTIGAGYKVLATEQTTLTTDGGLGIVTEKNPGLDATTSGAVSASEKLAHKLNAVTTFTQSATALWKMNDFGDALYTVGAGVTANIATRFQIKVEVVNTVKTRPPDAVTQKNDVAFLTSVIYKF
jgi:putative salt-induced outer membrane protein YdiY